MLLQGGLLPSYFHCFILFLLRFDFRNAPEMEGIHNCDFEEKLPNIDTQADDAGNDHLHAGYSFISPCQLLCHFPHSQLGDEEIPTSPDTHLKLPLGLICASYPAGQAWNTGTHTQAAKGISP